jgi:CHAD domain-containing protein
VSIVERELKVVADTGSELPDMTDVVEGLVVGATKPLHLSATYFDTPDWALIRSGVTLRSRSGEPGPTWTLKLPVTSENGALSRREIHFDGKPGTVPSAALEAVTAYVRKAKVLAVAVIETQRDSTELRMGEVVVATICDDHVVGTAGDTRSEFRELEVELVDQISGADLLKSVRARLRDAGWKIEVSPVPKLARVLGAAVIPGAIVPVQSVGRKARLKDAVQSAVAKSVSELIVFDAGTRLDLEIEDLHQFRVATRRLRSDLRTFSGALDRSWVRSVRAELRWLGDVVGGVRDLDVLAARLTQAIDALDETESGEVARLMATLEEQRMTARNAMLDAMRSPRYLNLLELLIEAATAPRYAPSEADDGSADDIAERLASRALPGLVRKTWKQLRGAAEELGPDSADEDLHEVRILAKRCRYAADAAAPVCGRDAKRFAAAVKELQTILGDHQDTVITEQWLRNAARSVPQVGLLAGLLVAEERKKRLVLRGSLEAVWKQVSRASLRTWMN